ncbi:MAG: acyltransferase [Flavobacteriales bacterium]|nr:acyltransferase [Flavobacteriales bacterium]
MKEYFKQIDALRAWAVFTVVFSHIPVIEGDNIKFLSILASYIPGVPLFFTISGFLISLIIINNRDNNKTTFLKNFYIRRFLRIFPIYYLTIIVLIIAIPGYRAWCMYDLLYISNIKIGLLGSFSGIESGHFWSLAVEEQFYLLWPVLMMICRKNVLFLIVSTFLLGITVAYFDNFSFLMKRTFIPICYLSLGALLAHVYSKKPEILLKTKKYLPIIFIPFIVMIILQSFNVIPLIKFKEIISLIIIPLTVIQFIGGFQNKILKRILENKLLLYFGKISYGIYVYHVFAIYPALVIKYLFSLSFLDNPTSMQVFKILLTIVIAGISWKLFEQKINSYKRYFKYSGKNE